MAATQVHAHRNFINTQQDSLFTYTYGEEVRFSPNMCVFLRPLTNAILEVDDGVYNHFPQVIDGKSPCAEEVFPERDKAIVDIQEAKSHGYFRDKDLTVVSFDDEVMESLTEDMLHNGPLQMVLNITERCNLRCKYCAFSGCYPKNRTHSQKTMEWGVVKSALDWYFDHSDREEYRIGFYGGEPLLVLPLLKKIVSYSRERVGDVCHFSITTNATLLNEKACEFIIRENISTTISLDGPKEIHDRYRLGRHGKGSFSLVMAGIQLLNNLDPEGYRKRVSFNIVLAPPINLISIRDFIDAHQSFFEGVPVMISPLNSQPSTVMSQLDTRPPKISESQQYQELYRHFEDMLMNGEPSGLERSLFSGNLIRIHLRPMKLMDSKTASHGQCMPGDRKVFINTDGTMYMCERVGSAYPIGKMPRGIEAEQVKVFLKAYNKFFAERCRTCWAIRLCRKCLSDLRTGDYFSYERTDEFCEAKRHSLKEWLALYCHIRGKKDDALDWIKDIEFA